MNIRNQIKNDKIFHANHKSNKYTYRVIFSSKNDRIN